MGKPYTLFIEQAERDGLEIMAGSAVLRAELQRAVQDMDDVHRVDTANKRWFDFRWMDMDIEEAAALKRREKEKSVLDSLPKSQRVPRRYMPTFASMLCTGILIVLHLLIVLLQVWSVKFNLWMNYQLVDGSEVEVPEEWLENDVLLEEGSVSSNPLLRPIVNKSKDDGGHGAVGSTSVDDNGDNTTTTSNHSHSAKSLMERIEQNNAHLVIPHPLPTHACITPQKTGESPLLVPILYMPTLGITLEYHRRRYHYHPETNTWIKVKCQTSMPLSFFSTWKGLSTTQQTLSSALRFGPNTCHIRQPTFRDLYKNQLLSPFTVFQLFCVLLWMLDEYWQYSAFTLFMILTFEATVVFSRMKSLSALRGMGNEERRVGVYRGGEWVYIWTGELLPGDILSLTRAVTVGGGGKKNAENGSGKNAKQPTQIAEDGDVVPADILLLRGSTVVNEASLTGESVPQMKEGLSELTEGETLDMKTRHKTHVLYAGTKMLQCKGVEAVEAEEASSDEEEETAATTTTNTKTTTTKSHHNYSDIPNPPDGGCLAFVLRTGFSSAQGKLVQMIEGSQEKVKGHERETALLLLLLFFFAVASSSYVLYHGLKKGGGNRSQYELLLHCILIVTSVIPPELPMQMALAVNNSLMTLMKLQIFCTEVSRFHCWLCCRECVYVVLVDWIVDCVTFI